MALFGIILFIGTLFILIKGYEIRLVLLISGLLMGLVSGKLFDVLRAFLLALVTNDVLLTVSAVLIYFMFMENMDGNKNLAKVCSKWMCLSRQFLVPAVVLLTFSINVLIPSAVGCVAVVGAVFIPLLINAGMKPSIAGASVVAGSWGSVLNNVSAHNQFISEIGHIDAGSVVDGHSQAAVVGVFIIAAVLKLIEHFSEPFDAASQDNDEKVDFVLAFLPLLPLIILIVTSPQVGVIKPLKIYQAVLVSLLITILFVIPQHITQKFFFRTATFLGNTVGLILTAAIFVEGLEMIGITQMLLDFCKNAGSHVKFSAAYEPFLYALLTGSGDMASMFFNATITPGLGKAGYSLTKVGSMAYISGSLGRTLSPFSCAVIVCSQLANVHVFKLTWINIIGIVVAAIVIMLILL